MAGRQGRASVRPAAEFAVGVMFSVCLTVVGAPAASASPESFCHELGGEFDGLYCSAVVTSVRNADRDIRIAIPDELVDDPVAGDTIRTYLRTLYDNWHSKAVDMAQDSYGEANFEVFAHRSVRSVVFHEDYHADGPAISNAYRTFSFDLDRGTRLGLTDLVEPGVDPLTEIPPLAAPYLASALDRAMPAHQPGTYPFTPDRWTPDRVYSGGYRAWALTADALVIYMPDYPVAHDVPIDYAPGMPVWSMDGGTVQVHIPLTALSPLLRAEYR